MTRLHCAPRAVRAHAQLRDDETWVVAHPSPELYGSVVLESRVQGYPVDQQLGGFVKCLDFLPRSEIEVFFW
jgi:hypothetical protein